MKPLIIIMIATLMTALSFAARAQNGFEVKPDPDLSLAPGGSTAHNFPAFQMSLATNEKLSPETFDFINGILASGRMSPNLKCRISARTIREERKFSTGTKLVELLEIELFTDHFGPRSLKFSFPMGAKLGRRIVNNQDEGPVEEIKIVTEEPYENWFQFQHDGKRVVWAEMGSMYDFAPCLLRR